MHRSFANHTGTEIPLPEDAALRAIVEGVESETGDQFFSQLVRHLATALACQYSFVTELQRDTRTFRTLAVWGRGKFLDNFEIPLKGTPCQDVLGGQIAHYPERIQQLFPDDQGIKNWGAESYCGVPLLDAAGVCVGHLAIFDDKPMFDGPRGVAVMRIFAARARTELERLRVEDALRESEHRFRDLFEEAPIAYLHQTIDTRILRANHSAMEILGVKPDEIVGLLATSLFPDTPEAQHRLRDALPLLAAGTDEKGVVLELRRKDDDKPLWVRWWCKPEPHGKFTRSMFMDITEQVMTQRENVRLAESEKEHRTILDAIPQLVSAFTPDAQYIYLNQGMMDYTGLSQEELKAADLLARILHPEDLARVREERARGFAQGVPFQTEQRLRRKDGQYRWILVYFRPVRDEYGELVRWYATGTDIDYQKRAELRLAAQHDYLLEEIRAEHNFDEMVGRSAALNAVLDQVRLVAPTDSTVLILGETGTGKELIARAIHSAGARRDQPLVKVNCAALPASLIESELFGHERGAFTGATEKRIGRFELANRGTIFLDEIGEVPPELQVKLLRVLQEHEFERIGGSQTIKVDVRVIAATNRDLACEIAEGTFRQDLYYRLNVFPLRIPPLRERPEDIGLLVHYFVRRYATKIGRKITQVPKGTMERLATYPWPGNVRELENVVERAVILSPGPDLEIGPEIFAAESAVAAQSPHKPDTVEGPPRAATKEARDSSSSQSLREIERSHIVAILSQTKWRIDGPNGAAQKLNLNSSTLRSRMKKLGIRRDDSDI